ncbi:MAG: hypothetical protein ACREN8_11985, partial [Candidatus Dormibacteraceae bacterium]
RYPDHLHSGFDRLLKGGSLATAVGLLIALPGIIMMYWGPDAVLGNLQPYDVYVTDLASLVLPGPLLYFAPQPLVTLARNFTGWPGEWTGYVGLPLLLLLGWIVYHWRKLPLVVWSAVVGVVILVLSLGPHLHVLGHATRIVLPWRVVDRIQAFEHTLPSRLMLYFFFLAAILVAVLVNGLRSEIRRPLLRFGLAVWLGVSFLVILLAYPWLVSAAPVPSFFTDGSAKQISQSSVALLVPYVNSSNPQGLYWQAASGYQFRMPEGYGAHPTTGLIFDPAPSATQHSLGLIDGGKGIPSQTPKLKHEISCELTSWQVHTVISGPQVKPDANGRFPNLAIGTPSARHWRSSGMVAGQTYL